MTSETYIINPQDMNPIIVNALPTVNSASKTIGMQNTGLPMPALLLAILMVLGGLLNTRINNLGE